MRDATGNYVAIASWPSREAWAATEPPIPHEDAYLATFRAALVESYTFETFTVEIDG
jgi:hypothetical protein